MERGLGENLRLRWPQTLFEIRLKPFGDRRVRPEIVERRPTIWNRHRKHAAHLEDLLASLKKSDWVRQVFQIMRRDYIVEMAGLVILSDCFLYRTSVSNYVHGLNGSDILR